MADFSNFELGQNVGELADGLLLKMADVFEVPVSAEPTAEELGQLVGVIGQRKTLQDNILDTKAQLVEYTGSEDAAVALAAQWLDLSAVQKPLDRSLWTPDEGAPLNATTVLTGAVANWQDRVANLVAESVLENKVYIPIGNRVMDSATEKPNNNVGTFFENEGRYPTEAEYSALFVAPVLETAGAEVTILPYYTSNGQEIAEAFVEDEPLLFTGYVRFARVANAGIQLACQFRQAAQQSGFDSYREDPQAFVLTDVFPIARTADEAKDPKNFQNPFTGIRQVALTGKLLVEATAN